MEVARKGVFMVAQIFNPVYPIIWNLSVFVGNIECYNVVELSPVSYIHNQTC
jgi:hypothetical protein